MEKTKTFFVVLGISLIIYQIFAQGTVVYEGTYPKPNYGYTYYIQLYEFKHKGYHIEYARSPSDLKKELSTMTITKIIRSRKTGRRSYGYYTFFVDDTQKKVIVTGITIKFKKNEIRALRL